MLVVTPEGRLKSIRNSSNALAPARCEIKNHTAPQPDCTCGVHYCASMSQLQTVALDFKRSFLYSVISMPSFAIVSGTPVGPTYADTFGAAPGRYKGLRAHRFDVIDIARYTLGSDPALIREWYDLELRK